MPEDLRAVQGGKVTKGKRSRMNFSAAQLDAFEEVFSKSQYPDVAVLEKLAEGMNLGIEKICTWFQNRRSKFRRASKKGHIDWMRAHIMAAGSHVEKEENAAAPPVTAARTTTATTTTAAPPAIEKSAVSSVLSSIRGPAGCGLSQRDFIETDPRAAKTPNQTRLDHIPVNPGSPPSSYHHMPLPSVSPFPPIYGGGPCSGGFVGASGTLLPPYQRDNPHHPATTHSSAPTYSECNYQLATWASHYPHPPPPPPHQSSACQNSAYPYADYTYPSFNFMNMHGGHGQSMKYGSQLGSGHENNGLYPVSAPHVSTMAADPLWSTNM